MADDLRVTVEKYLKSKLEDNGFAVTSDRYDHSVITWTSDKYWLFVVNDREQVFANVGRNDIQPKDDESTRWIISQFLGHNDFPRDYSGSAEEQVKRIARMLLDHWDEIFTNDLYVKSDAELRAYLQKLRDDY